MGEENAGSNQQPIIEQKRGRGRPAKDPTSNPTSNPASGIETSSGTSDGTSSEEIEVIGGVATGLIPPTDPPKRGRGRPPKDPNAPTPSKKPAGKKADKEQTQFMVQTLLSVAFNITSMRLGDHWKLTNTESAALAEPITAIMERHDITEKTGAYGDYIALVAAFGMVIVPKIMIQTQKPKQEGVLKLVRESKKPNEPTARPAEPKPQQQSHASANDGSSQRVHQSDTAYAPSDVKQSLAYLG